MAKLINGYNIVMQQKNGTTNKPIYPFTHTANVIDPNGTDLDTIIASFTAKNFVPDYTSETTSNLRFLRNDNTWATIQSASTSQAGVVTLSNSLTSTSEATAATSKAAKDLQDAIDILNGNVTTTGSVLKAVKDNAKDATYKVDESGTVITIAEGIEAAEESAKQAGIVNVIKQATAESGFASTYYVTQAGVQVGAKINIPKDYLVKSCSVKTCTEPDVPVEGYKVGDKYIDFVVNTTEGTGTESHIYLLVSELVDVYTGKTVTNGVSVYVSDSNEISAAISGKAIARANITDAFEANISALETYVGGKNVADRIFDEAKDAEYQTTGSTTVTIGEAISDLYEKIDDPNGTVSQKITTAIEALDATVTSASDDSGISVSVTEADGVITSVTASQTEASSTDNGYMTSAYAAKLDNCQEIVVSSSSPSFASGSGLWFQIVSEDEDED